MFAIKLLVVLYRFLWKAMDCHTEAGVIQEVVLILNCIRISNINVGEGRFSLPT